MDTHKHVHVAVAIAMWWIRLDDRSCAADSDGYQQLITWAERLRDVAVFTRGMARGRETARGDEAVLDDLDRRELL